MRALRRRPEPLNRRLVVGTVYGAGILQGAAFVLVPSLGTILAAAPYHFSISAYGLLYFPEIGGAILGALGAGRLQQYAGSQGVLRTGLAANLLGMLLLVLASLSAGPLAYGAILLETLALGLGFGLTLAAVNHYAAALFAAAETRAVTVLNGLVGAATALSPLLLDAAERMGNWGVWPALLLTGFALLLFAPLPDHRPSRQAQGYQWAMLPFALAVLLYAICEGSLSSWAAVYVGGNAPAGHWGALALSAFWASMTVFRLLLAFVPQQRLSRRAQLTLSALAIGVGFALVGRVQGGAALVVAFALSGAACSIYYPYVMALGLAAWPQRQVGLAGLLVAALLTGEGIGSCAPGALQAWSSLSDIYLASALWALPLAALAAWLPRLAGHPPGRPKNSA